MQKNSNTGNETERTASPFVKWVGGKRQLLDRLKPLFPKELGDYYEPFVGAGAVFLDVSQDPAFTAKSWHINDVNASLINCYRHIRDDVEALMDAIDGYDERVASAFASGGVQAAKEAYMAIRSEYNAHLVSSRFELDTAAMFICINKHCFNGLYRVNAKGEYNVPFNGKAVASYDADNLRACSKALANAVITCGDFEDALSGIGEGDFAFIDSPYAPLDATTFTKYAADDFTEADHRRLAKVCRELDKKGARFVATNHDTPLIREIYDGFDMQVVPVRRAVNRDASKRTGTEIIITNCR